MTSPLKALPLFNTPALPPPPARQAPAVLTTAPSPTALPPTPAGSPVAEQRDARHSPDAWDRHREAESPNLGEDGSYDDDVDYAAVATLRVAAAERLGKETGAGGRPLTTTERLDRARQIIRSLVEDHVSHARAGIYDRARTRRLEEAIFVAQFKAGRLQQFLDDPDMENVHIVGSYVQVHFFDGRIKLFPPVAESNEELLALVADVAEKHKRTFTPTSGGVDLDLDGARLRADGWDVAEPSIYIRRHRLVNVRLDDLVARGMMDHIVKEFLAAAVRAGKTIIVVGLPGAGKTTLLRALGNELHRHRKIVTIENARELYLHKMDGRHPNTVSYESRPGSGEIGPDGRQAGEVTMDSQLRKALRQGPTNLFIGEVLQGDELEVLFKAAQIGHGCMASLHAYSATAAIPRMVSMAIGARANTSGEYATRQVAEHIDLIVHVGLRNVGDGDDRFVTEIIGPRPSGDAGTGVEISHYFSPYGGDKQEEPAEGWDMSLIGRAVPGSTTGDRLLRDLQVHGFAPQLLNHPNGLWDENPVSDGRPL